MADFFKNKIMVAPMVRVSTLPFRLMALDYGADLVFTEETVDFKMLHAIKQQNEILDTVDFVDKRDGTVFFRTCNKEKEKVVFQIGSCDSQRALKVVKMVEPYVAAVNINMGCPKKFSIKGGMGAALLTQPEKVKAIVTTLVNGVNIPVTCKIRILPDIKDTLSLCHVIEESGAAAIIVHGRTRYERPRDPNHNDVIRELVESLSIPVIANGGSREINCYEDIKKFKMVTNTTSVMIARAAMWNCSVLRKDGYLPLDSVIKYYLYYCIIYDNPFTYSKYAVQNMLRELQETPKGKAFLETQTLEEIYTLWDLHSEFKKEFIHQEEKKKEIGFTERQKMLMPESINSIPKTELICEGKTLIEMPLTFIRGNFCHADLPKVLLNVHANKNSLKLPEYRVFQEEKFFISSVCMNGITYGSSLREKSRKYAEQAAALVCLHALNLVEERYGLMPSKSARKHFQAIKDCCSSSAVIKRKSKNLDNINKKLCNNDVNR